MSVKDLAEEAKKRVVFLVICVVGLSYIMSCKSSIAIPLILLINVDSLRLLHLLLSGRDCGVS